MFLAGFLSVMVLFLLSTTLWLALSPSRPDPLRLRNSPTTDKILLEQQHRRRNELEAGLRRRFPNATFRSVIDEELTGGTVLEADVKDWSVVRALELGIYNCYWHTPEGEYLPAGTTPDEEAMDAARLKVAVAIREEREATPAHPPTYAWWAKHMDPQSESVLATRAQWEVMVAEARKAEQPPYPWGEQVTKVLREADVMLPPIERMTAWDYNQNKGYWCLTVHYSGGTVYRAVRNQGRWNVTVSSLADLTAQLIGRGIVS